MSINWMEVDMEAERRIREREREDRLVFIGWVSALIACGIAVGLVVVHVLAMRGH